MKSPVSPKPNAIGPPHTLTLPNGLIEALAKNPDMEVEFITEEQARSLGWNGQDGNTVGSGDNASEFVVLDNIVDTSASSGPSTLPRRQPRERRLQQDVIGPLGRAYFAFHGYTPAEASLLAAFSQSVSDLPAFCEAVGVHIDIPANELSFIWMLLMQKA
ncbi:hypothetical protein VNI00_014491 [Paramarasmius palmivorus]|uniref:Uncharacterized protein n=1 Tax=Paramarasmius palmivorus TaxID=297713 RepID=A0AAW0BT61_9AGAR